MRMWEVAAGKHPDPGAEAMVGLSGVGWLDMVTKNISDNGFGRLARNFFLEIDQRGMP